METLKIDKNIINQYDKLPKGWVFFYLLGPSETDYLLCGYTANLRQRMLNLQGKVKDDATHLALFSKMQTLHWQVCSHGMEALLLYKCFVHDHAPEFQEQIQAHAGYAYLALDAHTFPFITLADDTQGDWLYLGPFRSRFFLSDVVDTFARILKLPSCDSSVHPCAKYESGSCRGWCLQLEEQTPDPQVPPLEKLETLLKEAFVHPENGILEMVKTERDKYYDDLEFDKAALLDEEIELLTKYRDWLKFLYVAKSLHHLEDNLEINCGRINEYKIANRTYRFPVDNTSYRENESLALDLAYVDESRMIYDYLLTREKECTNN